MEQTSPTTYTRRARSKKYHVIYKTTCKVTNKFYVGLHSTDDLNDGYKGSGKVIWNSLRKHGRDNHETVILEFCESREKLLQRESEIVNAEMIAHPMCMNLIRGGNATPKDSKVVLTEQAKQKMSQASKKFWDELKQNPEALQEHLNKTITPDAIQKRTKSNTGKKRSGKALENLRNAQAVSAASIPSEERTRRATLGHERRKQQGLGKVGGRPKGTPMSEERKERQREIGRMKAEELKIFKLNFIGPIQPKKLREKKSDMNPKVSCLACRREVTPSALTRFHKEC